MWNWMKNQTSEWCSVENSQSKFPRIVPHTHHVQSGGWCMTSFMLFPQSRPVICLIKLALGAASGCPGSAVCLSPESHVLNGWARGLMSRGDLSDFKTVSFINRQLLSIHIQTYTHVPGASMFLPVNMFAILFVQVSITLNILVYDKSWNMSSHILLHLYQHFCTK